MEAGGFVDRLLSQPTRQLGRLGGGRDRSGGAQLARAEGWRILLRGRGAADLAIGPVVQASPLLGRLGAPAGGIGRSAERGSRARMVEERG
jgi:hypothetical protein